MGGFGTRQRGSAGGRLSRIAGAAAALAVPLLPKCPLCLLPLAAAAGVTLPSRPLLDALVAACLAAWLATVFAAARWPPVKAAALAAAALILAGRWLDAPLGSGLGAAMVLAVVVWTRCRPRACGRAPGLGVAAEASRAASR